VWAEAELTALIASAPDMSLLDGVEFITPDPGDRLELYRSFRNSENDAGADHGFTVAGDLALLHRRAVADGFDVKGGDRPGDTSRSLQGRRH
jgi:hypothetical protein